MVTVLSQNIYIYIYACVPVFNLCSTMFEMNNRHCHSSDCAPTFEHNPVKRVLAAKNGRVVIECRPRAAPKPAFSWSKDTELLSNSTRWTVSFCLPRICEYFIHLYSFSKAGLPESSFVVLIPIFINHKLFSVTAWHIRVTFIHGEVFGNKMSFGADLVVKNVHWLDFGDLNNL